MYERKTKPLVSNRQFVSRIVRHLLITLNVILGALFFGMWGYHSFESQTWLDAFLNASMILGGMGPVSELKTAGGKLFAGFYALLSGFLFLTVFSFLIAPFVHRALHRFHLDDEDDS